MYTKTQLKEIFIKLSTKPVKTIVDFYLHHFLGVVQLSYSSTGEDVILDWIIKKDQGFYVDIGGFDPVYGSNTYLFYKKGWKGINVEPNITGLKKFRKKRPNDINLQLAAGGLNGELKFHVFDCAAMSTCDIETVSRYREAGYTIIDEYTVPIWTLEKIFDTYCKDTHIDILSVDVEGWDMDVLDSNNWKKYSPSYIILETVEYAKNGKGTWTKQNNVFDPYLLSKGYHIMTDTGINTIYKLSTSQNEG